MQWVRVHVTIAVGRSIELSKKFPPLLICVMQGIYLPVMTIDGVYSFTKDASRLGAGRLLRVVATVAVGRLGWNVTSWQTDDLLMREVGIVSIKKQLLNLHLQHHPHIWGKILGPHCTHLKGEISSCLRSRLLPFPLHQIRHSLIPILLPPIMLLRKFSSTSRSSLAAPLFLGIFFLWGGVVVRGDVAVLAFDLGVHSVSAL